MAYVLLARFHIYHLVISKTKSFIVSEIKHIKNMGNIVVPLYQCFIIWNDVNIITVVDIFLALILTCLSWNSRWVVIFYFTYFWICFFFLHNWLLSTNSYFRIIFLWETRSPTTYLTQEWRTWWQWYFLILIWLINNLDMFLKIICIFFYQMLNSLYKLIRLLMEYNNILLIWIV